MAPVPYPRPSPFQSQAMATSSSSRVNSSMSSSLPAGPCNYRDMRHGRHASNCGCQRFWLDEEQADVSPRPSSNSKSSSTLCFCGHHACFHKLELGDICNQDVTMEDMSQGSHAQDPLQGYTSVILSGRRQPMPPPSSRPSRVATPKVSLKLQSSQGFARLSPSRREGTQLHASHRHFGEQTRPRQSQSGSSSRNALNAPATMPSGLGLYLQQAEHSKLNNTGHASVDQIPSTQSESRATEPDTDREDPRYQSFSKASARYTVSAYQAPAIQIPKFLPRANNDENGLSATEVDTPSLAGTPVFAAADDTEHVVNRLSDQQQEPHPNKAQFAPMGVPQGNDEQHSNPARQGSERQWQTQDDNEADDLVDFTTQNPGLADLVESVAFARRQASQIPSLVASVKDLHTRVSCVENISFSNDLTAQVNDRLEFFDARLLELEGKVDDFERSYLESRGESDKATPDFSRLSRIVTGASGYGSTEVSNAHEMTMERLKGLEDRLDAIRGPTASQPRQVEVVLLPFSKDLPGLWFDAALASQRSAQDDHNADRSESANRGSQRSASNGTESRVNVDDDDEWFKETGGWLSPRACGPTSGVGGRVYDRLKSRGLVRNVIFRDGTARHIQFVIASAFDGILTGTCGGNSFDESNKHEHRRSGTLLGLKSPFVPLRKIHKSSRLRFLSSSELVTPSLWTMSFLDSSVFMRAPSAGFTRLYVTTPHAYLQPDHSTGWSWQRLRELPRVTAQDLAAKDNWDRTTSFDSNGVDEADACEPCWAFHEKLDPLPSAHSSFASNDSFQRHQKEKASFASSHPLSPRQTEPGCDADFQPDGASSAGFSASASSYEGRSDEMPSAHFAPITPLSELPPSSRQSLVGQRAASFPVNIIYSSNDAQVYERKIAETKRHVSSFEIGANNASHPSRPPITDIAPLHLSKRRRYSRQHDQSDRNNDASPTIRGGPWALTPRRSREPSSPFASGSGSRSGSNDSQLMLGNVDGFTVTDRMAEHDQEDDEADERTITWNINEKPNDTGSRERRHAADAYATPYSWSGGSRAGQGRLGGPAAGCGDTDVDMSSDADEDDAEADDPSFKIDVDDEEISEAEVERVLMMDEEAWEGVGGAGMGNSDEEEEDVGNERDNSVEDDDDEGGNDIARRRTGSDGCDDDDDDDDDE